MNNRIYYCFYDGSYMKMQIGFLILEIKPWHFINGVNPYYLIPLTLHCSDTCGDVWQRFNVSMQRNQGIWVAKETINIDYSRLEKPYNLRDPNVKAGRANTLSSTAVLLMTHGKDSEAESLLIEAKRVFRDLSYRGREEWRPYYAGSLINLADLYLRIGKVADAMHYYQHAANVLEKCKLGDPTYIRFALDHISEKTHILAVKKSEK